MPITLTSFTYAVLTSCLNSSSLKWESFILSMTLLKLSPPNLFLSQVPMVHRSLRQNIHWPLLILVSSSSVSSLCFPGEAHLSITRLLCGSAMLFKFYAIWITCRAHLKHSQAPFQEILIHKIWSKAPKFAFLASSWVLLTLTVFESYFE